MAGAVKHMERSHRSYHNQANFSQFERHAFKVSSMKKSKSGGVLDKIKKFFSKMKGDN